MKKSVAAIAVAGVVALGGAALAGPALAETTAPSATSPSSPSSPSSPAPSSTSTSGAADADRPGPQERITGALAGLVTDGTITQAQADAVATTLAEKLPRGGRDGFDDHDGRDGRDGLGRAAFGQIVTAAADALGISQTDLRTELQAGKSVADVAQERGVGLGTVTAAVTDAATTQIAAAVEAGSITQAQADAVTAGLDAKVAEELTEVDDDDHDGPGWHGGRGAPFAAPDATPAPTS